jgi:methionyl-tRNA formyltransferase
MKTPVRIVLLTGNDRRHQFVADALRENADLVGVVSEAKSPTIPPSTLLPLADQKILDRHFTERTHVEARLLGATSEFRAMDCLSVPCKSINDPSVFDWVRQRRPDFIALYGTGLIKAPLLDFFENRIINLHLGLSPYYRGAATNFWPFVNGEPECVGATIHLAVRDVDAGPILTQVRPAATETDRIHELGVKTIIGAARLLAQSIGDFAEGKIQAQTQDLSQGRVYRKKHFDAAAVRVAWNNLDAGMVSCFVRNRAARCAQFPIVECEAQLA